MLREIWGTEEWEWTRVLWTVCTLYRAFQVRREQHLNANGSYLKPWHCNLSLRVKGSFSALHQFISSRQAHKTLPACLSVQACLSIQGLFVWPGLYPVESTSVCCLARLSWNLLLWYQERKQLEKKRGGCKWLTYDVLGYTSRTFRSSTLLWIGL